MSRKSYIINLNRLFKWLDIKFNRVIFLFAIIYSFGAIGLALDYTFNLFVNLTPLILILTAIVLIFYHQNKNNLIRQILTFFIICVVSFFIEVIGANYKFIFGDYSYGQTLGLKLFSTPIIIGLNWLFLVYTTASILEIFKLNEFIKVILSSLLMVAYDLALEMVAPRLDMWHWKDNKPPLQNYISWFIIALIFHSILRLFKIQITNKIAPAFFIIQIMFLIILAFVLD